MYFQVQCDIYQEIIDLAIENLNKVKKLKKTQRMITEKKVDEKLICFDNFYCYDSLWERDAPGIC